MLANASQYQRRCCITRFDTSHMNTLAIRNASQLLSTKVGFHFKHRQHLADDFAERLAELLAQEIVGAKIVEGTSVSNVIVAERI